MKKEALTTIIVTLLFILVAESIGYMEALLIYFIFLTIYLFIKI